MILSFAGPIGSMDDFMIKGLLVRNAKRLQIEKALKPSNSALF
tara:strand:- start:131 stop:259 length:129 start_codon:yes stop_codon:yes gene_type:complete